MSSMQPFPGPGTDWFVHGGVLTPAIRRDIRDLNRQFLELGLAAELAADPRFGWSDAVRATLVETDPETRERMAGCPFALFELRLAAASRVEDGDGTRLAEPWHARCLAFAHFALFVALRLADAAPLATRIALGLTPGDELQLSELCPSEAARIAACRDVIRPRWPAYPRFWSMLRAAARADSHSGLRWAHCTGICLLGSELGTRRVP